MYVTVFSNSPVLLRPTNEVCEGYVFTGVCLSTRGVYSACNGAGGCLPRRRLSMGCLPRGCLPRACLPSGCLPRGVCPGGVYPGGCLPRGVSVQGDRAGVCPVKVSAQGEGGVFPGEVCLPREVCLPGGVYHISTPKTATKAVSTGPHSCECTVLGLERFLGCR